MGLATPAAAGKNFKVNWTCGTKSGQVTLANDGSASVTVPARTSVQRWTKWPPSRQPAAGL
ncbi:MAG: hypothetical protein V9G13_03705 [Marmoricola sp.]